MGVHRTSPTRIVIGLVVGLVGVVAFMGFTLWIHRVTGLSGEGVPAVACFVLVALGLGGLYAWARLARSAFLEARVEALGPVTPDGRLSARLVLDPRRPLTLVPGGSSVLVVTRKEEGDETSRVYEDRHPLPLPAQLLHRHEQRIDLALRPGLPSTSGPRKPDGFFARPTPRYSSELQVTLAIERWPDLLLRTPVQVPGAAPTAEDTGPAR